MSHGPNSMFSGAFSIGKAQRSNPTNTNEVPGPGQYTSAIVALHNGHQFSKAPRKPIYSPSITPEAGHYENQFKVVAQSGPSYKFPKALTQEDKSFPLGPGTYNPNESTKRAPAFTFQSKFEAAASESLKFPGPGTYQLLQIKNEKASNKGMTTGKRTDLLLSKGPGPGQYNPDQPVQSGSKFPKSQRSLESSQIGPGPGAFELTLPKKVGTTFGQKVYTSSQLSDVPGPGSYKIPSFLGAQKGVKIGTSQRSNQALRSMGPSPMEYDVSKYQYPSRHASFGTSKRAQIVQNLTTPGPAAYFVDSKLRKQGAIIPKAQKDNYHQDSYPGPGRYNPNDSATLNNGPSYHIAGKHEKIEEMSVLGPGRYNLQRDLTDGPKYKFAQDERSKEQNSIDHNRSHCYDIQQGIGFVPTYLQSHIN